MCSSAPEQHSGRLTSLPTGRVAHNLNSRFSKEIANHRKGTTYVNPICTMHQYYAHTTVNNTEELHTPDNACRICMYVRLSVWCKPIVHTKSLAVTSMPNSSTSAVSTSPKSAKHANIRALAPFCRDTCSNANVTNFVGP